MSAILRARCASAFLLVSVVLSALAFPSASFCAGFAPNQPEWFSGRWVPDVDATITHLSDIRTRPMESSELEDLRANIAAVGLNLDIPRRQAVETGPGGAQSSFTIENIELSEKSLIISGEHRRYTLRLREDGSIIVGQGIIMRRAE